jgi:hypothetical protein
VRIVFTDAEIKDCVRRSWAYELFLRAQPLERARDVPGIAEDIANDADSYSLLLQGGTTVPPPHHCFAAFLGPHLEDIMCGASERQTVIELHG